MYVCYCQSPNPLKFFFRNWNNSTGPVLIVTEICLMLKFWNHPVQSLSGRWGMKLDSTWARACSYSPGNVRGGFCSCPPPFSCFITWGTLGSDILVSMLTLVFSPVGWINILLGLYVVCDSGFPNSHSFIIQKQHWSCSSSCVTLNPVLILAHMLDENYIFATVVLKTRCFIFSPINF